MNKYRLLMNGKNFLIKVNNQEEKLGFYQTIYLESSNAEQAELDAVQIIRNSDLKELVLNDKEDPPMIYLEEIEEIDSFKGVENMIEGRAFYTDEENET